MLVLVGKTYVENPEKALKIKEKLSTEEKEQLTGFAQAYEEKTKGKIMHSFFFHISQDLCRNYSRELMFAVMSRMLFCRAVSPFCRAISIFFVP